MSAWVGALIGALATGLGTIVAWLPRLIGAAIILLIGWGIAKLVQTLVTKGLRAVHFNDLTERAHINSWLKRADIKTGPSAVMGIIAYWFVFLLAIHAAIGILGVVALTNLTQRIVLFLPLVFSALLIVVIGAWAAGLLGRMTTGAADGAGIPYAKILGSVVQGFVLFFAFAMALDVLGLTFPFLATAFAILLGSVALAGALAFGLGSREYASDILAGRELRSVFKPGDRVTAEGVEGTVEDIKPTITVLKTASGDVALQNSDLMHRGISRSRGPLPGEGGIGGMRAA